MSNDQLADKQSDLLLDLNPGDDEQEDDVDISDLFVSPPQAEREHGEFTLRPSVEDRNVRLDKYIASQLTTLSRSYIQQLIAGGHITVDGFQRQQTFKMTPGQVVQIDVPPPVPDTLEPEDIPL